MRRALLALALAASATVAMPGCGREDPASERVRATRDVALAIVGSRALGRPNDGRLLNGLQLPAQGPDWLTWDPILHRVPNRGERRWATEALIGLVTRVLRAYRDAHPDAPQVLIGDLSRRRGGPFGKRYGGLGHASHQNGVDADIYYPRADRALQAPTQPSEVDLVLAQDLVDRFVAAGVRFAFVGPRLGLRGPRKVVQAIPHHNDHVHVRIRTPQP